ncbi:hypothetical protein PVAP13_5NG196200 [Panicum virgatum]|uniref:Gcp-like domain-containing protein n=1 Tax=Panicum virgatum TaxID=38727 RepID=A0A8T0RUI3_PANVG|nr:hypothetical protein PVAP13_5NG196200 [Panicum virgatum]
MTAALLPTLSPPISRAIAAILRRRVPAKAFSSLRPPSTPHRFLASASSPYPATPPPTLRPLSTVASSCTAARAVPARRDLLMLGIETSCDDTAAAVVLVLSSSILLSILPAAAFRICAQLPRCCLSGWLPVRGDGEILSQVVSSQADLLARYGGVAPKMAEEAHALVIDLVVQKALDDAKLSGSDLSAVAVTVGPGLSLCLRVGVHKARQVAKSFGLPIVGVHHMEAHALVSRLVNKDLDFPFLALLISGRHNLLVLAHSLGQYVQLGTTIDDAIGEAYDKSARWLGLDMRKGGGPALEELALDGDPNAVNFRVPMRQHKDCNFFLCWSEDSSSIGN